VHDLDTIEELLDRVGAGARGQLCVAWMDRAARQHGADLFEQAQAKLAAATLRDQASAHDARDIKKLSRLFDDFIELAATDWRAAVDESMGDPAAWSNVLSLLGPSHVSPWSVLLSLNDEMKKLLLQRNSKARTRAASLLSCDAAGAAAYLRAGGSPHGASLIACARRDGELSQQRLEVIDLLPQ
jgi:hypothetical protein